MTDLPDTVRSGDAAAAGTAEAYCPACGQSFPPDHERCPTDGARLVRLAGQVDPLIGRVFEQRYEIRSRLGAGGMGAVYRGWQVSVDREVAIKVIDPRLSGNRSVVKRFLREARLSSRLGQPSIVNVYDFGQTEDGILYIVMELVRGHTLGDELAARHALGLHRTMTIGVQLCDALDAAHKQGIVHRDLKPGNVILLDEPPGRDLIKVLDLGLAKSLDHDPISNVTRSDALLGTPLYMSPEQIAGQPTDARADLYALGCMLHEMLSGSPPFGAPTVERVLANHIYELAAPLPAEVPPALADLIARLIAKHAADRPQTAAEVRDALFAELERTSGRLPRPRIAPLSSPGPIAPPITLPASQPLDTGRGRRRWPMAIALGALAGVAIGVAVLRGVPAQPSSDAQPGRVTQPGRASAAVADPTDAGPAVDAGLVEPVMRDAGAPADAPPDAGRRPVREPAHAPVRPPRHAPVPLDAGSELEFYRADAGR
ncbi:MAG: protein kinase [Kofleriaceae bacterium]